MKEPERISRIHHWAEYAWTLYAQEAGGSIASDMEIFMPERLGTVCDHNTNMYAIEKSDTNISSLRKHWGIAWTAIGRSNQRFNHQ